MIELPVRVSEPNVELVPLTKSVPPAMVRLTEGELKLVPSVRDAPELIVNVPLPVIEPENVPEPLDRVRPPPDPKATIPEPARAPTVWLVPPRETVPDDASVSSEALLRELLALKASVPAFTFVGPLKVFAPPSV